MTYPQIAAILHISEKTIEKNVRILREQGYMVRDGGNNGGAWIILKEFE